MGEKMNFIATICLMTLIVFYVKASEEEDELTEVLTEFEAELGQKKKINCGCNKSSQIGPCRLAVQKCFTDNAHKIRSGSKLMNLLFVKCCDQAKRFLPKTG